MRLVRHLPVTTLAAAIAVAGQAQAQTEITVATVNNNDMVIMQSLTDAFEQAHPDITLDWVVLEENVLRQRMTTDIATGGGQFDGQFDVVAEGLTLLDRKQPRRGRAGRRARGELLARRHRPPRPRLRSRARC